MTMTVMDDNDFCDIKTNITWKIPGRKRTKAISPTIQLIQPGMVYMSKLTMVVMMVMVVTMVMVVMIISEGWCTCSTWSG